MAAESVLGIVDFSISVSVLEGSGVGVGLGLGVWEGFGVLGLNGLKRGKSMSTVFSSSSMVFGFTES